MSPQSKRTTKIMEEQKTMEEPTTSDLWSKLTVRPQVQSEVWWNLTLCKNSKSIKSPKITSLQLPPNFLQIRTTWPKSTISKTEFTESWQRNDFFHVFSLLLCFNFIHLIHIKSINKNWMDKISDLWRIYLFVNGVVYQKSLKFARLYIKIISLLNVINCHSPF